MWSSPVDVSTLSDPDNVDQEAIVKDLAEDPIHPDTYPIGVVLTGQLCASGRSGIVCEQGDPVWSRRPARHCGPATRLGPSSCQARSVGYVLNILRQTGEFGHPPVGHAGTISTRSSSPARSDGFRV